MARPNDPHGKDRIPHDDAGGGAHTEHSENIQSRNPERGPEPLQRTRGPVDDDRAPVERREYDDTARDSFIGTDRGHRSANASWGAIFAGTVTFLAVLIVFGLVSAAMGLSDADGVAVGIWSIIAIILALAIAGYIAGALAVRSGLLHGLVTWATSLVGVVLLIGWLGTSVLGAVGGAVGGVAETAGGPAVVQEELEGAEDEADQAAQDAQDAAAEAQDDIAAGTWWGVAGLVVGAVVAGFAGVLGARSAHTRPDRVDAGPRQRRDR